MHSWTEIQAMGTRRVLIVGYDVHVLDGLATSVARYCLGCEVAVAKGGAEALMQFQERPFDLILTEQALPDMLGLDLAQAIHRLSPGTRIVLMVDAGTEQGGEGSAGSFPQAGAKGQSAIGPRDYIRKPVGIDQLWKAVHSLT
jgi:CheY-like chemotaxis protein